MEASAKLERLDRQQLVDLLEEHHAALRMSVLGAFDRLCCPVPTRETDVNSPLLHKGQLHTAPSSQPVEPSARDPLPADNWHQEAAVVDTATDGSSSEPLPAVEVKKSIHLVPEEGTTTSTVLVSVPSQSILGLENIVSKTKRYIDLVAGFLVLSNSMVMMLELEMEGRAVGSQLGLGDGSTWVLEEVEPTFQGLDTAFVYIFLAELLFRIFAEGRNFFFDVANWFDTILVLVGLADIWVIVPVTTGGSTDPQNIVMMRLFRAVKCLRAIRMVRTFRLFRGLNLLVKACQCFLPSLGWAMVLLFVFMSMGTLIMGNLLRSFVEDSSNLFEDRVWIWNRYGTAYRAMYTLYEVTFAGNWPTNARPVLEKVSHAFVLFFVVYVTIIVFAVIRVICLLVVIGVRRAQPLHAVTGLSGGAKESPEPVVCDNHSQDNKRAEKRKNQQQRNDKWRATAAKDSQERATAATVDKHKKIIKSGPQRPEGGFKNGPQWPGKGLLCWLCCLPGVFALPNSSLLVSHDYDLYSVSTGPYEGPHGCTAPTLPPWEFAALVPPQQLLQPQHCQQQQPEVQPRSLSFAAVGALCLWSQETLDAAQNDAQLVVREKAKASQEYVRRLNKVFQTMDLSQDGVVSKEEFLQLCQDPTIKSYMTSLDVDVADGSHLFKLLDDGDGNLTHSEFISGMMRFKGAAKAIDVIYLQREVEWLQQELLRLTDKLIGPDMNDKRSRRRSQRVVTKKESEMLSAKTLETIPAPDLPHEYLNTALKT